MAKVFVARSDANKRLLTGAKTFRAFLTELGLDARYDDVAFYNWGTNRPDEVNRALVELVGCATVAVDPLDSALDPALGTLKAIYEPIEWKPVDPVPLARESTIKVKPVLPPPAVSFVSCTPWFVPSAGTCDVRYMLEGPASRASKVDFEVHTSKYHDATTLAPCATVKGQAGTTHIYKVADALTVATPRAPDTAQTFNTWRGESQATDGIYEKKGGADSWIGHACAPYSAMLRYYKADGDNKAKVTLAPFFPRWNPKVSAAAPTPIDSSFIVSWDIAGDNDKLKAGKIVVRDKDNAIAFFAALDSVTLRTTKQYDLFTNAVKAWRRADAVPANMPYRVEIQAHSDSAEENGLAIAVTHTQVRALQYTHVQCIGMNVAPGTKQNPLGNTHPRVYLGDADDDTDIAARCTMLIDAIRGAAAAAETDAGANVLKLFVAPEFYFRGANGAYKVEKISSIVDRIRVETDKPAYADWLFMFGTVIGYLDHEGALLAAPKVPIVYRGRIRHAATVLSSAGALFGAVTARVRSTKAAPQVGWRVRQGNDERGITAVTTERAVGEYTLSLSGFLKLDVAAATLMAPIATIVAKEATRIRVRSAVPSRIPAAVGAPAAQWSVGSGAITEKITAVAEVVPGTPGEYWLSVASGLTFTVAEHAWFFEPTSTEVFNIALMQKGWPAQFAGPNDLKAAVIYKEYVSHIDFVRPGGSWSEAKNRLIAIHGDGSRVVFPTEGSRDVLGASPSVPGTPGAATWVDKSGGTHTVGSEINRSGVGGGSVVTMDGITFGVEVCLDHGKNRLHNFYAPGGGRAVGDPTVQLQLIPSWGMSIAGGRICCSKGGTNPGLVFNVDGQNPSSILRVNDDVFSCDSHPMQTALAVAVCPEPVSVYFCTTCPPTASRKGNYPGKCIAHDIALERRHVCTAKQRFCSQCHTRLDAAGACATHGAAGGVAPRHYCAAPKKAFRCPQGGCLQSRTQAGQCPTHPLRQLVEYRNCRTCGWHTGESCPSNHDLDEHCGYHNAPGNCAQPAGAKPILCNSWFVHGVPPACVCPVPAPALCNQQMKQIGTGLAPVRAPIDVASTRDANYLTAPGAVLIFPVRAMPDAGVVV